MKPCFKCNQVKPVTDFYRHPRMPDGYLNKCKECAKADVKANYVANRGHYVAYEAARTPGRTGYRRAARRKHRINNPEKAKARAAVSNAIRDGRLTKQPCGACGNQKAHAHHHDYSRPLDVHWLCFKHHLAEHGKVATREWSNRPGGAA